jgi:hypothetical protein
MTRLPASEHGQWDEFVAATPGASLFHSAWWHRAWQADVDIYARRGNDGKIQAGIPIYVGRRLGVRAVRRPPLTPVNGPVFRRSEKSRRSSRYSQDRKQINEAIAACPRLGFYDFSLPPGMTDVMPFLWNGYKPYIGYTYVISTDERDSWRSNMSEMNRRNLDKARKEAEQEGLTIDTGTKIVEALDLLVNTAESKGFSFKRHVDRIPTWWDEVTRRDAGRLYSICDSDGTPLCTTIMVWDAETAYYIAGGMREEIRAKSRLNLILFERMIRDAHERGTHFDFEGSTLVGVERFFRGWGGKLWPSFRLVKIPSIRAYILWCTHQYVRSGHHHRKWITYP